MSVVFDAASSTSGTNVSSLSWTHTPSGTPSAVGVGTMYWGTGSNRTVSSISYGSGNLTVAPGNPSGFNAQNDAATVWGLANPPSGAQTVTVTYSGSGCYPTAGAVTVTGSDTTTCYSNGNSGLGNSTSLSVTVTSATGELVFAIGGQDGSPTTVLTAGQTSRFGPLSSGDIRSLGETVDGAASVNMTISATNSARWAMAAASFKEAGAAASGPRRLTLLGVG